MQTYYIVAAAAKKEAMKVTCRAKYPVLFERVYLRYVTMTVVEYTKYIYR